MPSCLQQCLIAQVDHAACIDNDGVDVIGSVEHCVRELDIRSRPVLHGSHAMCFVHKVICAAGLLNGWVLWLSLVWAASNSSPPRTMLQHALCRRQSIVQRGRGVRAEYIM